MAEFGKFADGEPIPPCFSCEPEDEKYRVPSLPAEMIAMVPKVGGGIAFAAPLCLSHSTMALIAGWNPQFKLDTPDGRKAWDEHGWMNPKRPTRAETNNG